MAGRRAPRQIVGLQEALSMLDDDDLGDSFEDSDGGLPSSEESELDEHLLGGLSEDEVGDSEGESNDGGSEEDEHELGDDDNEVDDQLIAAGPGNDAGGRGGAPRGREAAFRG